MKRVYTAMTSVSAVPAADTTVAAAPEGFCTDDAGVILLLTPPLRTYPLVTKIPFCSASAQLKGETAAPLMPVILSARKTNWPATPFTPLLPVLVLTMQ